eukprot:478575-Rhodomonas_salina.1
MLHTAPQYRTSRRQTAPNATAQYRTSRSKYKPYRMSVPGFARYASTGHRVAHAWECGYQAHEGRVVHGP